MQMSPRLRKLALTVHVSVSIGWIGALAAFLALSVVGLVETDPIRVRGACIAMDVVARFVITPLAAAALATGLISALGTAWGLLKHYWVLVKFVLTVAAAAVLWSKLGPIRQLAETATAGPPGEELRALQLSLAVHAGGGLILLLAVSALGMLKPRGTTGIARAKEDGEAVHSMPGWVKVPAVIALVVVLLRLLLHLVGHAPPGH